MFGHPIGGGAEDDDGLGNAHLLQRSTPLRVGVLFGPNFLRRPPSLPPGFNARTHRDGRAYTARQNCPSEEKRRKESTHPKRLRGKSSVQGIGSRARYCQYRGDASNHTEVRECVQAPLSRSCFSRFERFSLAVSGLCKRKDRPVRTRGPLVLLTFSSFSIPFLNSLCIRSTSSRLIPIPGPSAPPPRLLTALSRFGPVLGLRSWPTTLRRLSLVPRRQTRRVEAENGWKKCVKICLRMMCARRSPLSIEICKDRRLATTARASARNRPPSASTVLGSQVWRLCTFGRLRAKR